MSEQKKPLSETCVDYSSQEVIKLKARVQELEARIKSLLNDPMTIQHYNKIKVETIEEAIKKYATKVSDVDGGLEIDVDDLLDEVAKLREGEE